MLTLLLALLTVGVTDEAVAPPSASSAYELLLKDFPGAAREYLNDRKDRGRAAAARFFAFVRDHRDAPEAVEALGWVANHCLYTAEAGEAMAWIAKDYARSPNLAPILIQADAMYGDPVEPKEAMLRVVRRDSPHLQVRGAAALCLARELRVKRVKAENDANQHELFFIKGSSVPFAVKPTATAADLDRWSAEAAALCESVADDPAYSSRLRTDAETTLREIRELSVGRPAPEIEGRDHEGKPFKLSDYRGKVVVLTFSTSGCAPCRAMYPMQRELIARHKSRPFALVSVYPDPDTDYLKKAVESGTITWRSWCDGDADGPISRRWNVHGYPTIFVIDGAGVIRHKLTLGVGLEETVDAMLGKTEDEARR